MVQYAQSSQAAGALTQMAARFAAGGGALGALVRERQDLSAEWQGLDARLTAELASAAAERNAQREKTLRARLAEIARHLDDLDTRMTKEFPAYAALANPQPLSIAEAQKYLAQNEALVVIASRLHQSLVWVITKSEARWILAPLGEEELTRDVAALRCGLDATAWNAGGASRCASLLGVSVQPDQPLPFDLTRAHALYSALLKPFADMLGDRHLLVAASGPLTALPLSVLVTEPPSVPFPARAAQYADVAWLAKSHATSVLPSVSSFASLRAVARPSAARNAFIGFGNPLLQGADGRNREAWARTSCASPPVSSLMRVAERGAPQGLSKFFRGTLADVGTLRRQSPLPETADELCTVAHELNADDRDVYLGARATETTIKALNDRGQLAAYHVVHFATHGLLSGETESLGFGAEPALLLTPPETATEADDGLLTASEVAKLKLDADWVVLSACNTAGAAKAGAQPFSGLARAFFYAGGRALLVSHWYVDSDAAVKLMTGAFAELRRDPSIGRAEAVRRAMLATMADGSRPSAWPAAHPSVWAPFVVVGEGGPVR
jgi:CHAT domain-containing protein